MTLRSLALASLLSLTACSGASPDAQIQTAQDAIASGDYDKAVAAADEGLGMSPDAKARWRLEFAKLEALARKGDGKATLGAIEALAAAEGTTVKSSHYVSTADQLKGGGDAAGAIAVLDAGLKRWPDDADLTKAIEQSKASGGEDELEALKSLGYLGE